jgi:RNA polymerase sigma factor (sigma-70 family)
MQDKVSQEDLKHYVALVKQYAKSIVAKHSDVYHNYDEIVSYGMYTLAQQLKAYIPERGGFVPFLINTYHNMLSFARKLEIENTLYCDFEDKEDQSFIFHTSTQENLDNADTKIAVDQLLSFLSDTERQIVIMRFYEGMTLQEIGKTVGVTRERIRQKLNEILEKLRKKAKRSMKLTSARELQH